ncbi:MAG: 16S rRNA (cytidine(1402)-2'-O)-methyltransferase [Lachnospiraceae bacterium]|nr:16S rRNA (cytidine(1402)-2'-O)-methyltransferase [Lachnospiraceae bacterium]
MAAGKLILCATPIGNLGDMTPRGIDALKEADLIAAEDTRNSVKLLNHFDIHTPMTAYHEFNRFEKADDLVRQILDGKTVVCITDAGTPGISDPGEVLVEKCIEAGIPVTSLPGANAALNALVLSGLSTRRFRFEGFLPREKKEKAEILAEIREDTATLVFYEAPHRLVKTLNDLLEALGDRKVAVCRELTKVHETVDRTTLNGAISLFTEQEPKGEFVLVVEGRDPKAKKAEERAKWDGWSIAEHVRHYEAQGIERKDALKRVALDRGIPKRDVYQAMLGEEGK